MYASGVIFRIDENDHRVWLEDAIINGVNLRYKQPIPVSADIGDVCAGMAGKRVHFELDNWGVATNVRFME